MKRRKKSLLIVLCIILFAAVIGGICIGAKIAPTVNHALRISELLQQVIDAPNQTMHISVSAKVDDETVALDTDVYLVTEADIPYLVLEQNGLTLFVADNILILENEIEFLENCLQVDSDKLEAKKEKKGDK